jgi:tetratricopeptide (TPR) repeat protein/NAD-dependent SIR2 family protein deacetylase
MRVVYRRVTCADYDSDTVDSTAAISLQDITKALQSKRKTAIFCGAGVSFNSGLPIVSALLTYLFEKLHLTAKEANSINKSNLPFESIMEVTLKESGLEEIQEIFSEGKPNSNHLFIAKLAKQKNIQIIYTTNFDLLIEKALEQEGLCQGKDFVVYSSQESLQLIDWKLDIIKVVKIHGCVSKKEEMAITMSMIASSQYSELRRDLLSQVLCDRQCGDVLIIGYSCSDIDLFPLIESFEGAKSSIYFIEHQHPSLTSRYEPISLKEQKNPFKAYRGQRIFADTNSVVKSLWESVVDEKYINIASSTTNWKWHLDQWYLKAVEESGEGVKNHIAARLLYAVGAFREAINHSKMAIDIALKDRNLKAYSSELGNLAMALDKVGNYKQACECLEKSIPLCRSIGNADGLLSQLQAYGNVLHHMRDHEKSIEKHKEALHLAKIVKDEFAVSNILGNMSNSYNHLGQLELAIESLREALVISRRLGNKQAESSQLGIISHTYFCSGLYSEALDCCLQGIEIKKQIGDRYGECQMLINLFSIYRALDRNDEIKAIADYTLALAEDLGNEQLSVMIKVSLSFL